ncbi:MFS transporter [Microlunatus parietis]|uniref:MFS family permease n=1 Tax=Microlunatus parietis TaxID=682979 RepID=A0A7Y9I9Z2_9ACTN|nr:MFS transporter [Microlunatus parietis]NYE73038.1 MFS family permease [Microlunatus parietis]
MYVTLRENRDRRTAAPPAEVPRRIPATVLGLGIVSLLTDISSESVTAVLPLYLTVVLGFGPLAYGFVDGINQAVSALVRLAGGWWADTTRRPKRIAVLGYGGSALSRVGFLLVQGFWPLTAMITLDRLGKGLRTGPRDAMIAAASDPRALGRNFGVHRALDTTGALIGPLLAFAILFAVPYGLGGYRSVFAVSAAFAVIGVAVLLLAVPATRFRPATAPALTPAPAEPAVDHRPAGRSRRLPVPGTLLVAAGLLGLVTIGDGFLYLALSEAGSVPPQLFPLLFVGTSVTYLALAVPFGRLADRFGRWKLFLAGHLVLLVGYLTTAAGPAGLPAVIAVVGLLGVYYAATDGVLSALAAQLSPESRRASGISAAQTVVAVSRFGSAVGFGLLWQLTDQQLALFVVAGALLLMVPVAGRLLATSVRRGSVTA